MFDYISQNALRISSHCITLPEKLSSIGAKKISEVSLGELAPIWESLSSTREIISCKENCFPIPDSIARSVSRRLSISPTPLLATLLLCWLLCRNFKLRDARVRISWASNNGSLSFENISSKRSHTVAVSTCVFTVHRFFAIGVDGSSSGSERKCARWRRIIGRQEIYEFLLVPSAHTRSLIDGSYFGVCKPWVLQAWYLEMTMDGVELERIYQYGQCNIRDG